MRPALACVATYATLRLWVDLRARAAVVNEIFG
jgi:hypothetical protein